MHLVANGTYRNEISLLCGEMAFQKKKCFEIYLKLEKKQVSEREHWPAYWEGERGRRDKQSQDTQRQQHK